MVSRDHVRRMLTFQQSQEVMLQRGFTEIAPGIWTDPISQARDDYDGSLAAHEAALMQIKSVYDTATGVGAPAMALDAVWDSAIEVSAYVVESDQALNPRDRERLMRLIRRLKREK